MPDDAPLQMLVVNCWKRYPLYHSMLVLPVALLGLIFFAVDRYDQVAFVEAGRFRCREQENTSVFLPRADPALPCQFHNIEVDSDSADAVFKSYADGPSTTIRAQILHAGQHELLACFCPVEYGWHVLNIRLDYIHRGAALQDPSSSAHDERPEFIGEAANKSLHRIYVDGSSHTVSTGSCKAPIHHEGAWWWPSRSSCNNPQGLVAQSQITYQELRHCLQREIRLAMLGDSVSERFCNYLAREFSPGCCTDCKDFISCLGGHAACVKLRGNGLFNDLETYEHALRWSSTTTGKGQPVLVFNVGLWDAAYGQLSAYEPQGKLARVIAAASAARRNGTRVIWRTTSAVDPSVAKRSGKLLPKHAYLNQPRIDRINQMATSQVLRAGLEVIDVAGMTYLRPDLLETGDMRHYNDGMHSEMAQLLAQRICPSQQLDPNPPR